MKKIMEFYSKHNRDIEKGNNLVTAIVIYYVVMFFVLILSVIIELAFEKNIYYLSAVCKLLSLIAIFLFYLDVSKRIDTKEIWLKRKMTLKIFLLIASLLIVMKFIFSIETKIIREIKGIGDILIPGTVEYVGTNWDKVIGAVIISPILEELMFRGVGLKSFNKMDNKLEAIIFTAVTFGLMHQNIAQGISGTICGLIFGYVAIEFGILYSIICHMLYNGMFYVVYFLNIDKLMQFVAILIIFWWVYSRKGIMTEIKNHLKSERKYSVKRQLVYFLNFPLLLYCILWIWMIISSI